MANDYHNVSVRLNSTDYKQLEYIHSKYNRMSYGKVSLADVLRIAVKDLYVIEQAKETGEQESKEITSPEQLDKALDKVRDSKEEEEPKPAPKKTTGKATANKSK